MKSKHAVLIFALMWTSTSNSTCATAIAPDSVSTFWQTGWHAGFGLRVVDLEGMRDGYMPEIDSYYGNPYLKSSQNFWIQKTLPKGFVHSPLEIRTEIGIERLVFEQENTVDIEYWNCVWFNCDYLGETMKLKHDITTISIGSEAIIKPYLRKKHVGSSFSVFTDIRYLFVKESENLKMNGGYVEDSISGTLSYQNEFLSRSMRTDQIGFETGLRWNVYLGKHISILISQISYQYSIELRPVPSVRYESSIDGDVLALPARSNNLNRFSFLFGFNLHL